jgi:hypothetical protein
MNLHYFNYNFTGGVLKCELEYEPAEYGQREGGLQIEPDYPACMTLCNAYINDVDVVDLLSEKTIADIEAAALKEN